MCQDLIAAAKGVAASIEIATRRKANHPWSKTYERQYSKLNVKCAREGFKASFLSLTSITYSGLAFTKCLVFMWGWLDGTRVLPSGLVRGWDVLDEAGWKVSAMGFNVRG